MEINFEEVNKWLCNIIERINIDKQNSYELSIEEIIQGDFVKNPGNIIQIYSEVFIYCLKAFSEIKNSVLEIPELLIEIDIELKSNNKNLKMGPSSLNELLKAVDLNYKSYVTIGTPNKVIFNPVMEYYCIPLPFLKNKYFADNFVNVYYSEYRSMNEHSLKDSFTRFVTFSSLLGDQIKNITSKKELKSEI